ncbi:reverse transcriptase family protein [Burkholderia pseudomultivorans]|uniref:reverse transcriptase family protein n=1 Tax=Burkholderia pseudomultivorans TaxID=1207504 RepID=UPI0009BDC86F|nr:reverse transcriptase family protein [Burkholderia pseudomultivorans]
MIQSALATVVDFSGYVRGRDSAVRSLENFLYPSTVATDMTQSRLSEIRDIGDLARATGIPKDFIAAYANSQAQSDAYSVVLIPKKGRKRRGHFRATFSANQEWLSQLHRGVAMIVLNSVDFGEHVQGFIKKRSIRTNAEHHLGAKQLLHADISNFFDSITTNQITQNLITVGAAPEAASLIAKSCTIDGLLRQGTRCSPILANLVCRSLDADMISLAQSIGAKYTRYADDLTFSGDQTPSSDSVDAIITQHGFTLRDGRCYLQQKGHRQYVTGLTVADTAQPHLPKRLKSRLRLVMHYIERNGVRAHFAHDCKRPIARNANELWGMLRFAKSIEPDLASTWLDQWKAGERIDSSKERRRLKKLARWL